MRAGIPAGVGIDAAIASLRTLLSGSGLATGHWRNMEIVRFWRALARIAVSLLSACILYIAWMAVFLVSTRVDSPVVETVLWLLAPVTTAAGFAAGMAIMERRARKTRASFLGIYVWALIGCASGAGMVYRFGPMLIAFAMLTAGTASMAIREMAGFLKRGESSEP